ncbi:MAG: sulfatase-like hydrolase/transferase [Pirellulaceae bacterium]
MTRTILLFGLGLLLCCPAVRLPAAETAPNIILVMADDQGWGDAGYQGHPDLQTPGLDSMARDGMRFNRFYAGAPVCSPTRGSALTGRHPYRYGVFFANTGHLLDREVTIAELLKTRGYATGHFGKWHLGTLTTTVKDANRGGPQSRKHFSPPGKNGFDESFSTESKTPTFDPLLRPKSAMGKHWWNPVVNAADANPYGTNYWRNGTRVTDALRGDDSEIIMNQALRFIRSQATAKQPFFSVIWFHAPHLPVVASKEDRATFQKYDLFKQHYLGSIVALDRQVTRLRKELSRLEVADNTLIFYCSDNGPEGKASAPGSAGALRGRKRSLYEGGIRVPGLVVWPGRVPSGTVTDMPASTSDYLPTILAILRISMPDDRPLDGVSLLPVFARPTAQRTQGIGFESGNQAAWIHNRYKLYTKGIASRKDTGKPPKKGNSLAYELYDLRVDPGEARDLAGTDPAKLKDMAAKLFAWRSSCYQSLSRGP